MQSQILVSHNSYTPHTMKVEIVKNIVDNLKHQMSGHNYQVTFGVDNYLKFIEKKRYQINLF